MERLKKLPIEKWKSQLDEWTSNGLGGVRHNDSYKNYIKDLQEQNWKISDKIARNLTKGPPEIILNLYECLPNKPDNMQHSIAVFAVASLHRRPKQLWTIYGGQGKSRIIAAAAMHALNEEKVENVHFVFPSRHLMKRDEKAFENHF